MGGVAAVPGRGRKPDPRKSKSKNINIPTFSEVVDIEPPEYMNDLKFAAMIWRSIVPELLKNELLRITDMHNVEVFCMAYETYRQSQKELTNGVTVMGASGSPIKNPALTALNEAVRQMATFGSLLGLDPSSRQRLTGAGDKNQTNPFAGVLNM
ncbi:phage terminase small subunit P27 family [Psychrobacter arenosus]|uniref:phage terminase small subunit P27 family n=1 Tax=Psychrobacter arenosus TaxID=256326 RepID=UPI00191B28E7|nr:phage terminase small subunit P27 family [Psychrobacter arenosus]